MKLACKNMPELRLQLRQALLAGYPRSDLLVFRMADGRAKLFFFDGFCRKYAEVHPDMVAELRDRYEKEIRSKRDILYVQAENGKYQIGLLDQPRKVVRTFGKGMVH